MLTVKKAQIPAATVATPHTQQSERTQYHVCYFSNYHFLKFWLVLRLFRLFHGMQFNIAE